MFPKKLYGVSFLFSKNHFERDIHNFEFELVTEFPVVLYRSVEDPIHMYVINENFKVTDTYYNLTDQQRIQAEQLRDEMLNEQEYLHFDPNDHLDVESVMESAQDVLFGAIFRPSFITDSKAKIKKHIRDVNAEHITKEIESIDRTLKMYNTDNQQVKEGYDKIEETLVDVADVKVGTEFHKFVPHVGVMTYKLLEIINIHQINQILYKVECISCRHQDPCVIYITHVENDRYCYVGNTNPKHEHRHYHTDSTLFHTNKKTSYKEYKEKINDYNTRVINEYEHRKLLYKHMGKINSKI